MHLHLDPLGGVAGDMFAAALLDTFPELAETVQRNLRLAGLDSKLDCGVQAEILPYDDGVLTGTRFALAGPASDPHHHHDNDHEHHHTRWSDLRAQLATSDLPDGVKARVIAIFHELAMAEAAVHGKPVDDVAFHEVGHWDSIADIVAAATLIEGAGVESWSVGALPLGRGWVETDHGRLPVPAPATALLLRGFACHDDGRTGERVTPTGAAILCHLAPACSVGPLPMVLERTGHGFGTRRLPGMSNVLRVLAFGTALTEDRVGVIEFEVDDQSAEDLALALDLIRDHDGVLDAIQTPAFGKKGRMIAAIRVLAHPQAMQAVMAQCLQQTTTLGLRHRIETRHILPRRATTASNGLRVKLAERPGGTTAKAELDDLARHAHSHQTRTVLRREAEAQALDHHHDH